MQQFTLHQKSFLLFLALISLGFVWILLPYGGAVFWGMILAILFAPLYRWVLVKTRQKPNLSAFLTLLCIVVLVILPLSLVAASLVDQASGLYQMINSGNYNVGSVFKKVMDALPTWVISMLERLDLTNLETLQKKVTAGAAQASQTVAKRAFSAGLDTFDFMVGLCIMLYLLYFLLRDGEALVATIKNAVPLSRKYKQRLFHSFTTVIRATVKGNILVALAQGALGGLIFWFLGVQAAMLWAVLMAFLSLLPAIGAAIVWGPVAMYFLLTGAIWQGVVLTAFGVIVIGLVDNILRPILVGKDTKMPDYVILLSTVGGMALFGLSGFVIGPVVAALFMAAWDLFANAREFRHE